jgi:hypothetical protein
MRIKHLNIVLLLLLTSSCVQKNINNISPSEINKDKKDTNLFSFLLSPKSHDLFDKKMKLDKKLFNLKWNKNPNQNRDEFRDPFNKENNFPPPPLIEEKRKQKEGFIDIKFEEKFVFKETEIGNKYSEYKIDKKNDLKRNIFNIPPVSNSYVAVREFSNNNIEKSMQDFLNRDNSNNNISTINKNNDSPSKNEVLASKPEVSNNSIIPTPESNYSNKEKTSNISSNVITSNNVSSNLPQNTNITSSSISVSSNSIPSTDGKKDIAGKEKPNKERMKGFPPPQKGMGMAYSRSGGEYNKQNLENPNNKNKPELKKLDLLENDKLQKEISIEKVKDKGILEKISLSIIESINNLFKKEENYDEAYKILKQSDNTTKKSKVIKKLDNKKNIKSELLDNQNEITLNKISYKESKSLDIIQKKLDFRISGDKNKF